MALHLGSSPNLKVVLGEVLHSMTGKPLEDAIYVMNGPVTFNGTSDYIETGIKLGEVDMDYTILVDVADISTGVQSTILNYMNEVSPYPGLVVRMSGTEIEATLGAGGRLFLTTGLNASPCRLAFVRDTTLNKYIGYWTINGEINSVIGSNAFHSSSQTLTIGSSKNASNAPWRFFEGTIDSFKLYDKALPEARITKFLKGGNK